MKLGCHELNLVEKPDSLRPLREAAFILESGESESEAAGVGMGRRW